MRNLLFISGTRADYNKLTHIINFLSKSNKITILLVDMHNDRRFGDTGKVVINSVKDNPNITVERKKYSVYSNVEHMKEEVRDAYKDKIDDYFFDIIFHLTDNQKELDYTAQVLNKYLQKVAQRDGTDNKVFESLVDFYRTRDIPKLLGRVEDLTTGAVREVR